MRLLVRLQREAIVLLMCCNDMQKYNFWQIMNYFVIWLSQAGRDLRFFSISMSTIFSLGALLLMVRTSDLCSLVLIL